MKRLIVALATFLCACGGRQSPVGGGDLDGGAAGLQGNQDATAAKGPAKSTKAASEKSSGLTKGVAKGEDEACAPVIVAGAYLTCAPLAASASRKNELNVGCRVEGGSAKAYDFKVNGELPAGVRAQVAPAKPTSSSKWHAVVIFRHAGAGLTDGADGRDALLAALKDSQAGLVAVDGAGREVRAATPEAARTGSTAIVPLSYGWEASEARVAETELAYELPEAAYTEADELPQYEEAQPKTSTEHQRTELASPSQAELETTEQTVVNAATEAPERPEVAAVEDGTVTNETLTTTEEVEAPAAATEVPAEEAEETDFVDEDDDDI